MSKFRYRVISERFVGRKVGDVVEYDHELSGVFLSVVERIEDAEPVKAEKSERPKVKRTKLKADVELVANVVDEQDEF